MRDILSDLQAAELLSDPNPMRRAQKQMLTPLSKRFYKDAGVEAQGGEFVVVLDGKPVKTPARKLLSLPTREAAGLVAAEFAVQVKEINPATMPFTRLANSAIDGVSTEVDAVLEDIKRFAGNDMLCYRAETPDALVLKQTDVWDPYLEWVKAKHGARLYMAEGVMHVQQPAEAIKAIGKALKAHSEPIALACLHAMTTLTGSAVLAMAVAEGHATAQEAWKVAHLEEDWTAEFWGEDREAAERRAWRWTEMDAAARMLTALRQSPEKV